MVHRLAMLIVVCWLVAGALPALAHEGAEDIAWVYVSGSSQADGQATIRVDIAELAVCDGLEPLELAAERADLEADGTLERVEPCRFEGEIALPESGRWLVAARFAFDDREAEVWMPVGVTDTAQTFERGDWLHAVGDDEAGWSTTRTLLLAAVGLGIGGVLTLGWRVFGSSRGRAGAVRG